MDTLKTQTHQRVAVFTNTMQGHPMLRHFNSQ